MSATAQVIPLDDSPNQSFKLSLAIDGTVKAFNVRLRYNEVAQYWVMTLLDAKNAVLLDSIPLVTGNVPSGNLLGQFAHLGLGSVFILDASGREEPDFPDNTNLGTDFILVWDRTPQA